MFSSSQDFLPYPLPPWEHDFSTLAIHCEVNEETLQPFIPQPLELISNRIQVAVMRFDCKVPERLYYDAAVIAKVRYGSVTGGFWPFAFNSTDQATTGTREIWGYNMKMAEINLIEDHNKTIGITKRLEKEVISISMEIREGEFEIEDMFPRLFLKMTPDSKEVDGVKKVIVKMDTKPQIKSHVKGSGTVKFGISSADPLYKLKITKNLGATLTHGHQVLPWGEELE